MGGIMIKINVLHCGDHEIDKLYQYIIPLWEIMTEYVLLLFHHCSDYSLKMVHHSEFYIPCMYRLYHTSDSYCVPSSLKPVLNTTLQTVHDASRIFKKIGKHLKYTSPTV